MIVAEPGTNQKSSEPLDRNMVSEIEAYQLPSELQGSTQLNDLPKCSAFQHERCKSGSKADANPRAPRGHLRRRPALRIGITSAQFWAEAFRNQKPPLRADSAVNRRAWAAISRPRYPVVSTSHFLAAR
jgi:hypothetical protein